MSTWELDGLGVRDHTIQVPLDYSMPDGATIEIYAREVWRTDSGEKLPYLLWFQGGPGGRAQRPSGDSGWMSAALDKFRIILIDQRGTGRSTPLTRSTLDPAWSPREIAEYAVHFRAPNIVRDAEKLREYFGVERWSILGQSFGGFLSLTYLSLAPHSIDYSFITAGLGDLSGHPDATYEKAFDKVTEETRQFFNDFPFAEKSLDEVIDLVEHSEVRLPTGEMLTVDHIRALGIQLGTDSGRLNLAYQLETAITEVRGTRQLSDTFLAEIVETLSFAKRPLYALLHESIYSRGSATRWSAQRVLEQRQSRDDIDVTFYGEMIFPWMFESDPSLTALKEAADIIANSDGLEDPYDDHNLAANEVSVYAAVYEKDMFVPIEISLETASKVSHVHLVRFDEYRHDGIRQDGKTILSALFAQAKL